MELNTQLEQKRLMWQCRRGMLEVELLLQAFVSSAFDDLMSIYWNDFQLLLDEPDPLLLEYMLDQEEPPEHFKPLINAIRNASHALN